MVLPPPTQRQSARGAWWMAGLCLCGMAGCDAFSSNTPPPPTRAERDAMRQEKEKSSTAKIIPAVAPSNEDDPNETQQDGATDVTVADDGDVSTLATPPGDHRFRIAPHTEWSMEETAADALGRIGVPAVPRLVECLSSPEPLVRRRAAEVLARIGPAAAAAVPTLAEHLRDVDPRVRQAAARALGQIGPAAAPAVPDLLDLFVRPGNDESTRLPESSDIPAAPSP